MGLHHCLSPQKRNLMSVMIVSTNFLLIHGKKCGILQKTAKNSQKPCFFVLICCKYGFASLLSPQKRNFMSEMIVSTNILLINGKKCLESWKKQQNNSQKSFFFCLNLLKIWVCITAFPREKVILCQ